MLEIFTVAFFGHRYIDNPFRVEELLEEEIRKFINEKEYVDFLVWLCRAMVWLCAFIVMKPLDTRAFEPL